MKIGIDYRLTNNFLTGIGSYTRCLVDSLIEENEAFFNFFLYVDSESKIKEVPIRKISIKRRNIWNQLLPLFLWKDGVNIYHATSNFDVPLYKNTKLVCTVCDMAPLSLPHLYNKKHRLLFKGLIGTALSLGDTIITISKASKREIISFFPKYSSKIQCIPLACAKQFVPIEKNKLNQVRERFSGGHPFFLYLGTHEPKKNLPLLLKAFKIVLERNNSFPYRLLIAGKEDIHTKELRKLAQTLSIESKVFFTGYVSDDELPMLYNASELFIFPSFHEGFGIPVLESMSCGTNVLCSSLPSLRELVEDAGFFFENNDVESLAVSIEDIISKPLESEIIRNKAIERSKAFSWKKVAHQTINAYKVVS